MNTLVPTPDTLPAAWGYFQVLLMLVFPLHLILMNAMLGCAAIAAYALLRKDQALKGLAWELGRTIPFLVASAVNLGVAALLFFQVIYGHLFYASSVLMGVYWLALVPLLITAYYFVYLFDFRFQALAKPAAVTLILLPLALFLSIAFIFSNNMTLMLSPEQWKAYFGNPGGTILNLGERMLIPRYLHFMTGGIAVGGLFVAMLGRVRKGMDPGVREAAEWVGMKVFTVLTGAQIVVGFLFLASLQRPVLLLFLGGDMLATGLLVLGVVSALIILVAGMARRVWLCAGIAAPLVYVMSFMRDIVRAGYIKPFYSPESLRVVPQYSPMVMFIVALAAGLASVVWMMKKAASSLGASRKNGAS